MFFSIQPFGDLSEKSLILCGKNHNYQSLNYTIGKQTNIH